MTVEGTSSAGNKKPAEETKETNVQFVLRNGVFGLASQALIGERLTKAVGDGLCHAASGIFSGIKDLVTEAGKTTIRGAGASMLMGAQAAARVAANPQIPQPAGLGVLNNLANRDYTMGPAWAGSANASSVGGDMFGGGGGFPLPPSASGHPTPSNIAPVFAPIEPAEQPQSGKQKLTPEQTQKLQEMFPGLLAAALDAERAKPAVDPITVKDETAKGKGTDGAEDTAKGGKADPSAPPAVDPALHKKWLEAVKGKSEEKIRDEVEKRPEFKKAVEDHDGLLESLLEAVKPR